MHEDQLTVGVAQVATLVAEQFPACAGEPVEPVDGGTVHAIFRIGVGIAARFPMRPGAPGRMADRLRAEAEASSEFRLVCPTAAPEPLFIGRPGHGYPLPWSLQTWIPGEIATPTAWEDSADLTDDLVDLVRALRRRDVAGRPFRGRGRGGRLQDHDDWMGECIRRSAGLVDVEVMARLWSRFRVLPRVDPDAMCHGDLIAANLIVEGGRLVGVLDTGGFGPADPALDLVVGWHLLADATRERFRSLLGCDDLEWERGMAWAFEQAIGAYWYYQDTNPAMADMGRTTLERVVAAATGAG